MRAKNGGTNLEELLKRYGRAYVHAENTGDWLGVEDAEIAILALFERARAVSSARSREIL